MSHVNDQPREPLRQKEITRRAARPVVMFLMWLYSVTFFWVAVSVTLERLEKSDWPTASGVIARGELEYVDETGHRSFAGYDYRFRYVVDGRWYSAEEASVGGTMIRDLIGDPYEVGDAVTVYYNPDRLFDAVIYPTHWDKEIPNYAMGFGLVIGSFFVFRKPSKRTAER